jgi:nitrate reductase assembly molybdenum cofactor insertion protein NarJ
VNRQVRAIAGISYAISPNLRVLLDTDLNALQNGGTNTFDRNRQMVYFATEFKF